MLTIDDIIADNAKYEPILPPYVVNSIYEWCERHIEENPNRHRFALGEIRDLNTPDYRPDSLEVIKSMHVSQPIFDSDTGEFLGWLVSDGSTDDDKDFKF